MADLKLDNPFGTGALWSSTFRSMAEIAGQYSLRHAEQPLDPGEKRNDGKYVYLNDAEHRMLWELATNKANQNARGETDTSKLEQALRLWANVPTPPPPPKTETTVTPAGSPAKKTAEGILKVAREDIEKQYKLFDDTFDNLLGILRQIKGIVTQAKKDLQTLGLKDAEAEKEIAKLRPSAEQFFELFDILDIAEQWEKGGNRSLSQAQSSERDQLIREINDIF